MSVLKKPCILVILGGGGHTKQMLLLVEKLGKRFSYEYVLAENDSVTESKIKIPGKIFKIKNPREMTDFSKLVVFFKTFRTSSQSLSALLQSEAKYILACGPGIAIPISILGKMLFRKRLIFIESWSRVYSKSLSGRLLSPMADLVFVQWSEQLERNYPKATFAGRLG